MSPTKKSLWLSTLLFVVLLPCSAAQAGLGDCPAPTSCDLVDVNGTPSGYSLWVYPVNGEWPIRGGDGNYTWIYEIRGGTSGTNQLTELNPVCCTELTYSVISGGQILAPGAGDPTTGFGLGDYQDRVVRLAYSPGSAGIPPNYSFMTNKFTQTRATSLQLKAGKSTYYCRSLAGPDCPLPRYVPLKTTEELTINVFTVRITRDGNGCIAGLEYFDPRPTLSNGSPNPNYNLWVVVTPQPANLNGENLVSCTSDGNQLCQECFIYSGDQSCRSWVSGGRTFTFCN